MRRQLFFLLVMLLFTKAEAARACSYAPGYEPPSLEELFAKATAVFVGRVVRVEEAGVVSVREILAVPPWVKVETVPPKDFVESLPPYPAIEATFRVVEIVKGQPPADGKVRAPRYVHCNGPLVLAGLDHIFFLSESNFVRSWM